MFRFHYFYIFYDDKRCGPDKIPTLSEGKSVVARLDYVRRSDTCLFKGKESSTGVRLTLVDERPLDVRRELRSCTRSCGGSRTTLADLIYEQLGGVVDVTKGGTCDSLGV